jgi:hypothetical protein
MRRSRSENVTYIKKQRNRKGEKEKQGKKKKLVIAFLTMYSLHHALRKYSPLKRM